MTSSWKLHLNAADEETPVKFCIRQKHIFFVYIFIISYAEKMLYGRNEIGNDAYELFGRQMQGR